jgi:amino acid transporter
MWAFSLWLAYFYFISRCFFAHAFDRVLPMKMAHVTSRTHAPSVSLVITWIIAMLGLWLSTLAPPPYNILVVQLNFSLVIVWMMAIAAAVGVVFPFISKDRFEATPKVARIKIGGVPLFSVISAVTLAVCIAMTAGFLVSPAAYGAISIGSLGSILVLFLSGVVIYFGARWYHLKKEGVDIRMLYAEIPPA